MGESDRVDLNEIARDLLPSELAEVVDFVGYLISKRERDRQLGRAAGAWEKAGATEMASTLADLESDLPEGQVRGWLADLAAAAMPVRLNPDTGEIGETDG